jgi:toxin HigB-1
MLWRRRSLNRRAAATRQLVARFGLAASRTGTDTIHLCADETTRDLFGNINSKSARRIPNTAWKAVQRKLKQLDLVTRLDDLQIPPGNDLHALKGDQAGRHAIKVNDQYRVTFRWEGHDAFDVCCEDYH